MLRVLIYSGQTVHVVPGEDGVWTVVDLQRRAAGFPSKAAALDYAKRLAAASPPSQVVLFNALGGTETVARYQLPQYQSSQATDQGDGSLFEATVKALVIGGLVTAGVAVLHDLVDSVERDLKEELARSKNAQKGKRRRRAA